MTERDEAARDGRDEPCIAEVWNGSRKVTLYAKEVLRVWGPNMDNEMSIEPLDINTAQAAFDWLYASHPPAPDRDAVVEAEREACEQAAFDAYAKCTPEFYALEGPAGMARAMIAAIRNRATAEKQGGRDE